MKISEIVALDAANIRKTPDGYLVAAPRVARTGIQVYSGREAGKPEMDSVRVYRSDSEVFSADSLRSYAHKPLTVDHPPVAVNSTNWREYSVGMTGEDVVRDGEFVRVPMVLMDAASIKRVDSGDKVELSLGYTTDLKWEPGTTPAGETYDAVQTNIRANHLAVVGTARGGPDLRIGDEDRHMTDTSPKMKSMAVGDQVVEVADLSAGVLQRHLEAMGKQIDSLKSKLDEETQAASKSKTDSAAALDVAVKTKDAEIATLKTQLADAQKRAEPAALEALVKDRATVLDRAKKILPSVTTDGKSVGEIRRQVVDARMGETSKGWSDDQITASFNTLTAGDGVDALRTALHTPHNSTQARDSAYAERDKGLAEAWRGGRAA